jgi:hypothetical protein
MLQDVHNWTERNDGTFCKDELWFDRDSIRGPPYNIRHVNSVKKTGEYLFAYLFIKVSSTNYVSYTASNGRMILFKEITVAYFKVLCIQLEVPRKTTEKFSHWR